MSDVKLNVGFLGARLGYGDLRVFTQSGDAGADDFSSIVDAAGFRNAMMTIKLKAQDVSAAPPAPAPAAPAPAPAAAPDQAAGAATKDPAATLVRLAELRDQGILSPEEFETKKAEILARM